MLRTTKWRTIASSCGISFLPVGIGAYERERGALAHQGEVEDVVGTMAGGAASEIRLAGPAEPAYEKNSTTSMN